MNIIVKSKLKFYWTRRTGELIDIDEMNEEHLRNALKMVIRNFHKSKPSRPEQVSLVGDAANMFNDDQEQAQLEEDMGDFTDDLYQALNPKK